jgi:hypothetical protein
MQVDCLPRLDDICLLPIIESLESNSLLKKLVLQNPRGGLSVAVSNLVRRHLETTKTMKDSSLSVVVACQRGELSSDRSRLDPRGCTFDDDGSTLLFESIL